MNLAAEFAKTLRFSLEHYNWEWHGGEDWHKIKELFKRDIDNYIIIDAVTHGKVKISKFDVFRDDDKIGDVLILMYPALCRRCRKENKNITIQKAALLVRLVEQQQPSHKDTITPEIKSEDTEVKCHGQSDNATATPSSKDGSLLPKCPSSPSQVQP